jgi:hypothetical protein
MIQSIDVQWTEWTTKIRKTWKPTFISSTDLAYKGIDTVKLRKYCDRSVYYHAIQFNISGTIKYWFERRNLQSMIIDSGADWRAYKGWEERIFK